MNLLGLDLASRLTGWCVGDGAQVPECGAWAFADTRDEDGRHDFGLLLSNLEQYLNLAFRRFTPGAVAYEAPLLITRGRRGADPAQERGFGDNLAKLRLLYPLGAFVEYYCHREGVPCYEVTVAEIKKEVTGNRFADKTDLVEIAQKCGLQLPAASAGADDAADAFGAWLLLLRAHDKTRSAEWDRKVWTPKGALL